MQVDLATGQATAHTLPEVRQLCNPALNKSKPVQTCLDLQPHRLAVIETTPNPDFFATTLAFTSTSPLHACTNWELELEVRRSSPRRTRLAPHQVAVRPAPCACKVTMCRKTCLALYPPRSAFPDLL